MKLLKFNCCLNQYVSLSLICVWLTGCVVGPDYQRPLLEVPAEYKHGGLYQGWKLAEPSDHIDRSNWWEIYGDPQLNDLISQALAQNEDIKLTEARYRQAIALNQSARSAQYPMLDGNISSQRDKRSSTVANFPGAGRIINTHDLTFSASWELDLWGRIRRQVESANADVEATAADT